MANSVWKIQGALAALAAATPAWAQEPVHTGTELVAPAQRLTGMTVFANSTIPVKAVMAGLAIAALAAIVIWALEVARLRKGRVDPTSVNVGFISAVVIAGPLFGLAAAAYSLLIVSIYVANAGAAPTFEALAPALAEGAMTVALGLFAAAIAAVARGSLLAMTGAAQPGPG